MKKITFIFHFVFLFVLVAFSKQAPIVIKAGKLIDVVKGQILENQIIIIDNNIIVEVGNAKDIKIPANAIIVDLSKYTVMPGLIDCHTHLTFEPSKDYYESIFRSTILDNALLVPEFAKKTLLAGITSCRDVGSAQFLDIALRNAINSGKLIGPRIQAAGLYIGSTGSHGDLNGFSPFLDWKIPKEMNGIADGIDEIRKQVRYNIKYGAEVIKFGASAGVLSEEESVGAPQYSQIEMNALVEEAKMWGKKTCAHAHGTEAIKMAVKAGVSSIEHGSFLDNEGIQLMLQKGTYLVADIYNDDYILSEYSKLGYPEKIINKERLVGRLQRENFAKAVKAGVKVAFGTDAGVYPHGNNGRQFFYMVQYGLSPIQAIQAATINAADLLGWQDKVGTIEKNKFADIIATDGNILEDIRCLEKISFVMKDGVIYKSHLHTEKQ